MSLLNGLRTQPVGTFKHHKVPVINGYSSVVASIQIRDPSDYGIVDVYVVFAAYTRYETRDYDEAQARITCMCGESMANHGNPMACGHTPISMYDHYQTKESNTMNYTTAIFLIPQAKVKALKAAYDLDSEGKPVNGKIYTFKTFDEYKVGDIIVVPTADDHRVGFTTCKVIETDVDVDIESHIQFKWVVGRVDLDGYKDILSREEKLINQLKAGERRRKRAQMAESLGLGEAELADAAALLEAPKA